MPSFICAHQTFAMRVPRSLTCNLNRLIQSLASHSRRQASDQVGFSPSSKVARGDKGSGDLFVFKGLALFYFVQQQMAFVASHFGILICWAS
jgi:hypothetical protein